MPQNDENKDKSELFLRARQVGMLTTIPFILLLGPLIGYFAGSWIDRKWDLAPYGTIVLIVLGFAAAVRETVRLLRQTLRQL